MSDLFTHLLAFWAGGVVVSLVLSTLAFTEGAMELPPPKRLFSLIVNLAAWPITIPLAVLKLKGPP